MKKKHFNKLKNLLFNFIVALIIVYILFGILFFLFQKSFIYFPNNQDFENCIGFNDYQKINHNGTRFYFKENSQSAIIYYHGNTGSTCDRSLIKSIFEETNYSLIFVEYAGYSNDPKTSSKKLLLKDTENINDFLEKNSFTNNIVYGQSLGSGSASYHASFGNIKHLILTSPFSKMSDVVQSRIKIYPAFLLLTENYDNSKYLNNFKEKITIIHGDNDKIINHKHSQKLYNSIKTENKEYILISGYGHNDIWFSNSFQERIKSLLEEY